MARPSKWSGETTAIRVPKAIAPILLDYAQTLDSFVQNPNQNLFDDDYCLGDLVYHKGEPYLGDGFIDHLTPYAVYVLWQYSPEHINWKELSPKGYGRQFCTKYIIKKTAWAVAHTVKI